MSDRLKEFAIKTTIIIGWIGLGGMILLIPIVLLFDIPETFNIEAMFNVFLAILFVGGFTLIILIFSLGEIKLKPVRAEIRKVKYSNFSELKTCFDKVLFQSGYKEWKNIKLDEAKGEIKLYLNNEKWTTWDCVALIQIQELTNEVEKNISIELSNIIKQYCKENNIYKKRMVIVLCVERITPIFQKIVNGNIRQEFNSYRLPVGISFGGKKMYIATQKDGFAILQYKKLKKEFLRIIGNTIIDE